MSNKILAPPLHLTIIYRETLVRTLTSVVIPLLSNQAMPYKLLLLCAPAGYGKTLLLADTMRHTSVSCCWYFLEPQDTDPARFLQTLFASIRQHFPAFGSHLVPMFSEQSEHASSEHWIGLLDALVNALKAEIAEPFLLTFCGYQEVNQCPFINHLVNYLLANLPAQGTVIIESRVMPSLALAPLIARRQMFGLGSRELRFSAQEVYDLARLHDIAAITMQKAEQIARSFGGWIAGILLGSSLGYSHLPLQTFLHLGADTQPVLRSDHKPLLMYVTKEIFAQETATHEFLKQTSVLARLTAAHCNALLGITDAEQQLVYAEQHGLFLERTEGDPDRQTNVYVCHPVLRELFQEELFTHSLESYLALNSQAAHLFLAEGNDEYALTHALQAREYQLAIKILPRIANACVACKGTKTMRDWLGLLPKELLSRDPRLLLILADIYDVSGEKHELVQLLDTVETLLHDESSEDPSTLPLMWAELYILRAKVLFSEGECQRAQQFCQDALSLLPADQRLLRIKALQCLGVGLISETGEISQGAIYLKHALQLSKPQQEDVQIAVLHRQLGTAYTWLGNYVLAEHHQKRALSIWEQMDNPRGIIYSQIAMGQLKRRRGSTQEAEALLTRALQLARESHHFKSGEAFALEGFGQLAYDMGQYTQALVYLEDSLSIAHTLKDTYLIRCNLCHLASIHALMDDVPTAQFLLNQVEFKQQEKSSYEGLLYCLAQGSIFLAQHAYDQAEETLEDAVLLAQNTNRVLLHIRLLLHLAYCSLKQGKRQKALQISKQVLDLNKQSDHTPTIQVDLNHFPELPALLDQASRKDKLRKKTSGALILENGALSQQTHQPACLRILAFGEPQVFSGEIAVSCWRMARAMELYFFLLENDRPLRKEQIVVALWPDIEDEKADQTFRSTIYYLRKAIGEVCLEYTSGLYRLNLAALYGEHIFYDVATFEACYREGNKALEREDDERAASAFTQMIDLYKGDYLQPFYSNWCVFRRDQLRQAYIDARHHMAAICWHREDWEESLQHWQHLLTLEPCCEKAHYGIMRYYLHRRQRELAIKQYQRYCRTLQEELQATPSATLQKLYRQILGEKPLPN